MNIFVSWSGAAVDSFLTIPHLENVKEFLPFYLEAGTGHLRDLAF
jgi:hypothetical protein